MKTLEVRLWEGDQAKQVIENVAFVAAFEAIEQEITTQWTNSPARDVEGREKCWQYLTLLKKVRMHLESTLDTGKLARLELTHKQGMVDRAKAWMG
jgi:hypothetical protein